MNKSQLERRILVVRLRDNENKTFKEISTIIGVCNNRARELYMDGKHTLSWYKDPIFAAMPREYSYALIKAGYDTSEKLIPIKDILYDYKPKFCSGGYQRQFREILDIISNEKGIEK